ncbi:hypothetical protein [Actinoallomurus rhizosphaericola]|uniref:hypothetical protein n=1 Tax=Actinoallomurus rhizosphaericola TaxID=2952536 RepID=UPI0020929DF6|nr:hypothetical protein [Actinoallomurus rhizosphaericola]MCO5998684.1 hypothetical protein [Actinoallomurus rhizosphaericola]
MAISVWEPSIVCDIATRRLIERFDRIPAEKIERCVRNVWVCALHTGARADARLLETLAQGLLEALPGYAETAEPLTGVLIEPPAEEPARRRDDGWAFA